jgi:hypothetical protein
MKLGMAVVNVEYRLARVSLAPAAVAQVGHQRFHCKMEVLLLL